MKICTRCKKEKPIEAFSKRTTGKPVSHCKECVNAAFREKYAENKDGFAEKNRQRLPKYRKRNKQYMIEHLRNNPCVDCGEADIEVLEFDHIIHGSGQKVTNLNACSLERLQAEIDKCQVRCANCHTRRTRRQFGWSRG